MFRLRTIIGIAALIGLVAMYAGDDDNGSKEKTSSSINFEKAYEQYENRHKGVKSSYLPHAGTMKGNDYQNCVDKKYYGSYDQIDFCSWHAGVGKYQ